jgi:putative peptide zinc metalloprotease protein
LQDRPGAEDFDDIPSQPEASLDEPVTNGTSEFWYAKHNQRGGAAPKDLSLAADEFTSERMLKRSDPAPKKGWRRGLYRMTAGLVNPGPSEAEEYESELLKRVRAPIADTRRVAVISRKGGVGKTTTTLMLGHTFAEYRGDRVVAFDGNPDAGSLGYRVPRETSNNIIDLLNAHDDIRRYSDIRAYTNQASTRLEVVAASDDPGIIDGLGEEGYQRVAQLLEYHYNLTCMDTGTGILESATQGILDLADQIVVVMGPSIDSARTAASTLDWLEQNGRADLVERAVAVINSTSEGDGRVEVDRIDDHFLARCRDLVHIPRDSQLEAGAEAGLSDLAAETRDAYLQLAASVADGFSEPRSKLRGVSDGAAAG